MHQNLCQTPQRSRLDMHLQFIYDFNKRTTFRQTLQPETGDACAISFFLSGRGEGKGRGRNGREGGKGNSTLVVVYFLKSCVISIFSMRACSRGLLNILLLAILSPDGRYCMTILSSECQPQPQR